MTGSMTRLRLVFRLLTMLAAVTQACSESNAPSGLLSGRWRSDSAYGGVEFTLTHRDTVIDGRGVVLSTPPKALAVIGFYSSLSVDDPVILTFSAVNTIPAIFIGHLTTAGDSIIGSLQLTFNQLKDTVAFSRY